MQERKKLLLIMNPKSGVMLAPKYLSEIVERFSRAGYLTQVLMTTARGDAREFAVNYGGDVDVVVVSGGDGTLNEVIDGLIASGHHTDIGYIPSGSTNDFANSIGLSKSIFDCTDTIINGSPRSIDIGSFNGRHFSYVASFGAFASTTYQVPQNLKNLLGHAAYVLGGIKDIASIRAIHARITSDPGTAQEAVYEDDYLLGTVCNSLSIGGILNLEKLDVDMNDGFMEVLLVKMPGDIISLSEIVISMLNGSFKSSQIEAFSAKDVIVEIDEKTHWTLDGEYEEGARFCEIHTIESAVSVII